MLGILKIIEFENFPQVEISKFMRISFLKNLKFKQSLKKITASVFDAHFVIMKTLFS